MTTRIGGSVYIAGDGLSVDALLAASDFRAARPAHAVVVAGADFGAGGCDAAAVKRLREAGVQAVIAESFVTQFNTEAGAHADDSVFVIESAYRLVDGFETGDRVEIDLQRMHLRDSNGSAAYPLKQRKWGIAC